MDDNKRTPAIAVKMPTDAPDGTFEGVVSIFGNVDSYGDVMMPGAFTRSLGEWQQSGRKIPVLWMHDGYSPAIGAVEHAEETTEGLFVRASLLVDDVQTAREVYAGMKAGAQHEFSFGYRERRAEDVMDTEGNKTHREVHDVDLFEISPVFRGANPDTRLVTVKSERTPQEPPGATGQDATPARDHLSRANQLARLRA